MERWDDRSFRTPINLIKNFINEINDKKGVCEIANDNAEGQIIVSGDKEKIDFLQTI